MRLPRSTIEQWAIIHTIVEEGSFTAAAKTLNRSQSSISYAVTRLQDALGIQLFIPEGRRAILTHTGSLLLAEILPILTEFERIERRAQNLSKGAPSTIRLLVNALFPKDRLFTALQAFKEQFPDTDIHLIETIRRTIHDVSEEEYDLAILIATAHQTTEIITTERVIAVAHRDHPLAQSKHSLSGPTLAQYPCTEVRGLDDPKTHLMTSGRVWRVNTIETAINAVHHGLCYGYLPEETVEDDIKEGTLCPLSIEAGSARIIPLGLYRRHLSSLESPAILALWELLKNE